jgi:hypothetical protein
MTFRAGMTLVADDRAHHPRPTMTRPGWALLDGPCDFAYDDDDLGLTQQWWTDASHFDRTIVLPFPPESRASGIGDTGFHPVVWYRLVVTRESLTTLSANDGKACKNRRLLLHFGAVDHDAIVWVDGIEAGSHRGGQTAFTLDITDIVDASTSAEHVIVVRAHDDPVDRAQPRGKQGLQLHPQGIWYERSTGIWRPVWLESAPAVHITRLSWQVNMAAGTATALVELNRQPGHGLSLSAELSSAGELIARATTQIHERSGKLRLTIPHAERHAWSPGKPQLIDALVRVDDDLVSSYLGLRDIGTTGHALTVNGHNYELRQVLEQCYWPDSLYTPPDTAALDREIELITAMGFNGLRIHQQTPDPRLLHRADKAGLLVFAEIGNAQTYSADAVHRLHQEWADTVLDTRGHPSIVCWVPINESWGVPGISHDDEQASFAISMAVLTRRLDPTRPALSNDGWQHVDSDLLTIHDYDARPFVLRRRYQRRAAQRLRRAGQVGPASRFIVVGDWQRCDVPMLLDECGGVRFALRGAPATGRRWGYSSVRTQWGFRRRLTRMVAAIRSSRALGGFCWTQLTDTAQEANGLCDAQRRPKLPLAQLRAIFGPTSP